MSKSFACSLLFFSAVSVASANTCEELNVSIYNQSGHACILSNSQLSHGTLLAGQIPTTIAKGSFSPQFTLQQSYTAGPDMHLTFDCENKTITLHLRQNYCLLSAGTIEGDFTGSNNIHGSYTMKMGSFWDSLPGRLDWTIY